MLKCIRDINYTLTGEWVMCLVQCTTIYTQLYNTIYINVTTGFFKKKKSLVAPDWINGMWLIVTVRSNFIA